MKKYKVYTSIINKMDEKYKIWTLQEQIDFRKVNFVEIPKAYFWFFSVQTKGWQKFVCAISRKLLSCWKTYICCTGGPTLVLKWIQNGPKIVLNGPSSIPIPGVSKRLLPGGKQLEKNIFLRIFYNVYEKRSKTILFQGASPITLFFLFVGFCIIRLF